ncbi:hypothetical protein [Streptomyces sp. 769]|uniref:hypothetical protein n=1 Tax=Streptomyces sp. 769 TaxID=1262452 RepID=UPI00058079DF|nr:hypothetical protein [Streptomyces sp. 769]AJC58074.1 hypothetical protein GZL_05499 [Streptomyces sp. 769]
MTVARAVVRPAPGGILRPLSARRGHTPRRDVRLRQPPVALGERPPALLTPPPLAAASGAPVLLAVALLVAGTATGGRTAEHLPFPAAGYAVPAAAAALSLAATATATAARRSRPA